MYTAPHRPSILHRPVKAGSQATTETFDTQHEREQRILALKAAKHAETQDRLIRSLYPTPEDKLDAADQVRASMDQHLKAREYQRLQEKAREEMWVRPSSAGPPPAADAASPWQATTYTAYGNKDEEDQARRRVAAQVALDNRLMIQQNAVRKVHEEEAERMVAKMTVTDESSFWNLGSTNDRWLAAERRRSPREHHAAAAAAGGGTAPVHARAPYAADGQGPMPPSRGSPAGQQQLGEAGYQALMGRTGSAMPGGGPIVAWGDKPPPQPQQQTYEGYVVMAGAAGAADATPWATENADPDGGDGLSVYEMQQQRQGLATLRYGSRPPARACPWATDGDFNAHQQAFHAEQQVVLERAADARTQAAWAPAAAPQRYGARPEQQPRPFAYAAEPQGYEQPCVMAAGAAALATMPSQRYASRPEPQPRPFAYGGGASDGGGVEAAGYAAAVPPAGQFSRFGSRPEPQPRPFAYGYEPSVEGSAGRQQQLQLGGQPGGAAAVAALATAPSLRYGSRPEPQPRPFAYEEDDLLLQRDRLPTAAAAGAAAAAAAVAARPPTAPPQQRFTSRPEPRPCPWAVDRPAQQQQQPTAPHAAAEQQSFPWL